MFEDIINQLEREQKISVKVSKKLKKLKKENIPKQTVSKTLIKTDLSIDKKVKIISNIPEKERVSPQIPVPNKKSGIVELW